MSLMLAMHSLKTSLFRYVGEDYSNAQEAMEEAMQSFYRQSSKQRLLSNPTVGQLTAVRGDDGDELTRGQVLEVIDSNKVKVTCFLFLLYLFSKAPYIP